MSLISKFENPVVVKPGDTLYLGNKYDAVSTKFVDLNRISMTPNQSMTVPKDAPADMIEHLQNLVDNRSLSTKEPHMSNLRKKPIADIKSFSTKQVEDMTFSELRFTADKLKIEYTKEDSRDYLREKINEQLKSPDKRLKRKG